MQQHKDILEWIKKENEIEIRLTQRRIKWAIEEYIDRLGEIWKKYEKECEYCTEDDIAMNNEYLDEVTKLQSEIEDKYKLDEIEHEDCDVSIVKTTKHFIIRAYTTVGSKYIDFEVELNEETIFLIDLINKVIEGVKE